MASAGPSTLFAGDLNDPWVVGLAGSLPPGTVRLSCHERLPLSWPDGLPPSLRTLVLHRAIPSRSDAEVLARIRAQRGPESLKVVFCVGSHARFHQLERWGPLVDAMLPEATAAEILPRHLADAPSRTLPRGPLPAVAVVSSLFDLGSILAESCRASGYPARLFRDWSGIPRRVPVLWDVPVLDPGWPEVLRTQSQQRPILCVIGLADREIVTLARRTGAAACLDSLFETADLAFLLDRSVLSYYRSLGPPASVPFRHRKPA